MASTSTLKIAAISGLVIAGSLASFFFIRSLKSRNSSLIPIKIRKVTTILILYGSSTGTSLNFALLLQQHLLLHIKTNHEKTIDYTSINIIVKDMEEFDDSDIESNKYVIFLASTWTDGQPPSKAKRLYDWLHDYATDFRVSKAHLKYVSYAVFGLGGKIYGRNFCKFVSN